GLAPLTEVTRADVVTLNHRGNVGRQALGPRGPLLLLACARVGAGQERLQVAAFALRALPDGSAGKGRVPGRYLAQGALAPVAEREVVLRLRVLLGPGPDDVSLTRWELTVGRVDVGGHLMGERRPS